MFGFPPFQPPGMTNQIDNVTIEVQDLTGNWRVHSVTMNIPAMILSEMTTAKMVNNGAQVRAMNSSGSIVNIM